MSLTIGFTGTRKGMNWTQRSVIFKLLQSLSPGKAVHGMCKGADMQFDDLCVLAKIPVEAYPPNLPRYQGKPSRCCNRRLKVHPPSPPLKRNKVIVQLSDLMIATPHTKQEELRSGTWVTIRYAKQQKSRLWIIFKDGTITTYTPTTKREKGAKGAKVKYVKENRAS